MLLAQEINSSSLTAGAALYPLAIIALGALVKWWMAGTERAIKAVAEDVKLVVAAQGEQREKLARLDERVQRLRADYDRLHQWKNEVFANLAPERK